MSREELLGYRAELLERLGRQAAELAALRQRLPAEAWGRRAVPGAKAPHEVLAHMHAVEATSSLPCLRRILTEDEPVLPMQKDQLPEPALVPSESVDALVEAFARGRAEALALMRTLAPGAWARGGFHPHAGRRTAQWWAERMYQRAREGLADIRRAAQAEAEEDR